MAVTSQDSALNNRKTALCDDLNNCSVYDVSSITRFSSKGA